MNKAFWLVTVCAALCVAGCGDDSDDGDGTPDGGGTPMAPNTMDASAGDGDGDTTGTPTTMPPTTTPPEPLTCGGETCTVSAGAAMLGTTACCTEDDKCGGQAALFNGCIELGQPGSYAEHCPDFAVEGFPINFGGCCTAEGLCGVLDDSEGGFGCIPSSALPEIDTDGGTDGPLNCDYDPEESCNEILEVYCDGPEDCSGGQQCCGEFSGGYTSFTCQDNCVQLTADGDVWSEICHPGQSCDQPLPAPDGGMPPTQMPLPDGGIAAYECRMNTTYLPDFWYRCRDTGEAPPSDAGSTAAGEINCGDGVCGAGQKCCYSLEPNAEITDGIAHCVPADEPCTCKPSGAGEDGGI